MGRGEEIPLGWRMQAIKTGERGAMWAAWEEASQDRGGLC